MVVVSDTTTISNLLKVKLLLIIKDLYSQIIIPQAVYDELSAVKGRKGILDAHDWIKVLSIQNKDIQQLFHIINKPELCR